MCRCELRVGSMLILNILKSFMEEGSWDAFGVFNTWSKFSIVCVVLLLLSFYSIRITPSCRIKVKFHSFSRILFISFFMCLILPQRVYWLYFLLAWLSTYRSFALALAGFIQCLETLLGRIPGYNIAIDLEMGGSLVLPPSHES